MSDFVNSEGEDIDDPSEGINEIIDFMIPFLKSADKVSNLKEKLNEMGVNNFTTFTVLKETDLHSIIPVANFRLMMRKFSDRTVGNQRNNPSPKYYSFNLKSLLRSNFYDKLEANKEIISEQEHQKLAQVVADDIRENADFVSGKAVERIALNIIESYPLSMGVLTNDMAEKVEAASNFAKSVSNHIKYIKDVKARRRKRLGEVTNPSPKRRKFSKAAQYALDGERDLPPKLPDEETPQTQEAKRVSMCEMAKSDSFDMKYVKSLMNECYVSIRWDIAAAKNLEDLLVRWPFLAKHSVLQTHFETLMNVKLSVNEMATFLNNLEKFFEQESGRKRKGAAKDITMNLKKILKMMRHILNETPDATSSGSCHLLAMVRCAMVYLEVPVEELFIHFEANTSFDEVQASPKLPAHGKPVIAVLGDNVLLNPRCFVVLDKRILCRDELSASKCLTILIMSYFMFRVEFRNEATPVLQMLHRKLFGIIAEGTRQGRTKTANGYGQAPKDIHPKLGSMLKKLNTFLFELGYA